MKKFFDFFLGGGGDEPTPSQIRKAFKQVTQPHGDPAVRLGAIDRLKAWGTPEAIAALLRRYTIRTPSGVTDQDECQQVEQMLVDLGVRAVEPIVAFLERESSVAYPARALSQILSREQYVGRILGVLEKLEGGFGSQPEQRAGLLVALSDHQDPRIAPAAVRFLADPDDDVAIAASNLIGRPDGEAHRGDLVDLLARTRERPRVREHVAELLVGLGWPTGEDRKRVQETLPEGFFLDKKGRVVRP